MNNDGTFETQEINGSTTDQALKELTFLQIKELVEQLDNYKSLHKLANIEAKKINERARELWKQLKDCEEALRFYADRDNYEKMEGSYGRSYQNYHALITEDDTENYIGGLRARLYFEKYEGQ